MFPNDDVLHDPTGEPFAPMSPSSAAHRSGGTRPALPSSGAHRLSLQPPQDLLMMLWQRRWAVLSAVIACLLAAGAYLWVAEPIYAPYAQLYVKQPVPGTRNLAAAATEADPESYLNTQVQLIYSSAVLERVASQPDVRAMLTFAGAENPLLAIRARLTVEPGRDDDTIYIALEGPQPEEAAWVVNAIARSYMDYQQANLRDVAGEMLRILEQERALRADELARQRQSMLKYQRENATLSFADERGNVTLQRLSQLSDALTTAQVETTRAAAEFDAARALIDDPDLSGQLVDSLAALGGGGGGARIERGGKHDAVRDELLRMQVNLATAERRQGPNHPALQQLRQTIADLKDELAEMDRVAALAHLNGLRQSWAAAQAKEAAIGEAVEEQKELAMGLNAVAGEFAVLQAGVEQAQKVVDALEERVTELRVARDAGGLRVTLLEEARGDVPPIGPRRKAILGGALLLGLCLGGAYAFVRGITDSRLRSGDDIGAALRLPILSGVPHINGGRTQRERGLLVHVDPMSEAAEAYRMVRTAIYFGGHGQPRTLLITSPAKSEGKSTVASNLAIALAQAGERTLLLDADLRKPSQHTLFGLDGKVGLSSVLVKERPLRSVIFATGCDNLDVLPAGAPPSNPSELLNGPMFAKMLDKLAGHYDRVVLDAPPAAGLADPLIMAARCDATLFVLRAGQSDRRLSESACAALASVGARFLGVVLNDVHRRDAYYGGTYGYITSSAGPMLASSVAAATSTAPSPHASGIDEHRGSLQQDASVEDEPVTPWTVEPIVPPAETAAAVATPATTSPTSTTSTTEECDRGNT